ncbi:MAG: thioredoxin domain-containing protein, partial [Deltaproteobacteria bacterium]|nr:thioredoxin domain-containing protein [Deltaproteobacteria bacterium]
MKKEGVIVAWVVTGLLGFAAGLLIRWSPGGLPEAGDGPLLRVPAKGDPAAAVVLEEFSDFQCPFCARLALDSLRQVRDRYGDRVLLRFHHFPLRSHRMALPAARAAMAASLQGRFWEMHDRLFEQGKDLSEEVLVALARQAGLDTARFLWDLEDPRVEAHVQADADLSRALGLRGAPTLFVNGHMLMGAQPFEDLAARIDAELEAVAALRAEGVPAAELYRRRAEANGASEAFLSHVVEGTPVAPPEKKKSPGTGSDGREALIPATRGRV